MNEPALWLIPAAVAAGLAMVLIAWRPLRGIFREIHVERAREMFGLQRERLELLFIEAATATGKPRGLRWADCDWANEVKFARDRTNGRLVALVGVTVRFEAQEGGDMEGWPQVDELRNATGVFWFARGQWHTDGRALFNMNPDEALDRLPTQFERVEVA
jgi:hypothetical protein